MIELSHRLARIAAFIPEGSRVADIGSDHALLPVYLVQKNKAVSAVAGELNPGPFAAAERQVREAGLSGRIDVRRGDGLEVIRPGEVDVVTIAGMGGSLVSHILESGLSRLDGVRRLVLQPNVGADHVRRWLVRSGWVLESEEILEEDGKIYEILNAVMSDSNAAERRNAELYREQRLYGLTVGTERLFAMGPFLLAEGSEVFIRKWKGESGKLRKIVREMAKSDQDTALLKKKEIEKEISEIAEVLACLQKGRPSSN